MHINFGVTLGNFAGIILKQLALSVGLCECVCGCDNCGPPVLGRVDRVWKCRWSWHYLSHHSGRLALAVVAGCWAAALALVVTLELTGSVQHPMRGHICPGDDGAPAQRPTTAAPVSPWSQVNG